MKVWNMPMSCNPTGIANTKEMEDQVIEAIECIGKSAASLSSVDELNLFKNIITYRLKNDPEFALVTTEEEQVKIQQALRDINATEPNAAKKQLRSLKMKVRAPLLRADERRARPSALIQLRNAVNNAENSLKLASTNARTIEKFEQYLQISKAWIDIAQNIGVHDTPSLLSKDITRFASTILMKIPKLFVLSIDSSSNKGGKTEEL